MYNSSLNFVVKSIQKSPLVNLNGLIYQEYEDFFDDVFFKKIKIDLEKLKSTPSAKWTSLENQEHKPREKLFYRSKLSKELNILFKNNQITNSLEKKYNTALKFCSCDLWRDGVGYFIVPHVDDNRIKLAVQIYLNESSSSGTKFFSSTVNGIIEKEKWKDEYLQHEMKEVYYKRNFGYSLFNNHNSLHGVVPNKTDNRLSIYVRYIEK